MFVAQALQHALLLVVEQGDAFERVIRHPAGELRAIEVVVAEARSLERDGRQRRGVGVHHAVGVVARAVDGAVQREAGRVGRVVRGLDQAAVQVHLEQIGGGHLVVVQAEGVDQVMALFARQAQRDVVEDGFGPAEMIDQVVAVGQLAAQGPFGFGAAGRPQGIG
ncbi:ribulose-5-phosphate 4-epimerase domain protein [Acinetobacter baumannii 1419130]|nr:ribulose-5-phosphate 4-epimerase domain protein [Acinetobacter baumannii 1419130]